MIDIVQKTNRYNNFFAKTELIIEVRKEYRSVYLNTRFNVKKEKDLTAELIIKLVGRNYCFFEGWENAPGQKRELVEARQIAMKIMRDNLYKNKFKTKKITFSKIASYFNKDHATVVHSIKVVENTLDINKIFKSKFFEFLYNNNLKYEKYEF